MSADNTAVGNTVGDSNTAVGSDTTVASDTSVNTTVASNTTSANNTAVGNTIGANNAAVGNIAGNNNTAVGSMEAEITMAIAEVSTSDADNIADQIVAQNIKEQQEEQETEQQQTGKYADSTTLIAYMGYVPGFNAYSQIQLPEASDWYDPKTIYGNVLMSDNTQAFYGMYADSLNGINKIIQGQPKL
jgi:predicted phage tail protein